MTDRREKGRAAPSGRCASLLFPFSGSGGGVLTASGPRKAADGPVPVQGPVLRAVAVDGLILIPFKKIMN